MLGIGSGNPFDGNKNSSRNQYYRSEFKTAGKRALKAASKYFFEKYSEEVPINAAGQVIKST